MLTPCRSVNRLKLEQFSVKQAASVVNCPCTMDPYIGYITANYTVNGYGLLLHRRTIIWRFTKTQH